ncbi:hypothetical protein WICANDRAFT_85757 [Wickerhamomyces anomalus NRRL Y-366-8]|uniref:Uncharacterized protein n=1 Tax=Wickerhamomyces anomalus (strain ATCC 58044 / CBS 1984 / NCYC 433 / NRRL Y-366-8) TaxID=683960 RepID=A0A1E3NWY4_WICAA|nr:uncharacterized protein WICANDRAFT_85757 [Wickerhamomyces anomalus NRRL Y-366-8]ODQ57643.1 hypothetical protein WICANDRAFT_85757 [Wickerhamomyces anomalus NRRL Y-366-8]
MEFINLWTIELISVDEMLMYYYHKDIRGRVAGVGVYWSLIMYPSLRSTHDNLQAIIMKNISYYWVHSRLESIV